MFKNVGSFIETESNVNLQPKRRKVAEKKTPLPTKSMKTMFTKILMKKNEEIEIY